MSTARFELSLLEFGDIGWDCIWTSHQEVDGQSMQQVNVEALQKTLTEHGGLGGFLATEPQAKAARTETKCSGGAGRVVGSCHERAPEERLSECPGSFAGVRPGERQRS